MTGRAHPEHWIFPKGHIEPGEGIRAAAAREIGEETGFACTIADALGDSEYEHDGKRVRCRYFLAMVCGAWQGETEQFRQRRWCDFREARALLSFPDGRRLLERAMSILEPEDKSRPPSF